MSARRRPNMRRLVDTTLALVRSGEVSHEVAAAQLLAAGVPVAVIGRVLASVPPAQVPQAAQAVREPVTRSPGLALAPLRTEAALASSAC